MVRFDLAKPKTFKELLDIIDIAESKDKIIAGGTDVLVSMKDPNNTNERLVYIGDIEELRFIKEDTKGLHIGAGTIIAELEENEIIKKKYTALYEASQIMANTQVRNLGTIGGNICNASPAGDTIAPLMVLDAQVKIESKQSSKWVSLNDFFTGPRQTILKKNEIVTEILIPKNDLVSAYERIGSRKASSISICGCAVALNVVNGVYKDIKVALSSVAPTVVRSYEFEKEVLGRKVESLDFAGCQQLLSKCINPITDRRASKWYRSEVAKALANKAIDKATKIAVGEV